MSSTEADNYEMNDKGEPCRRVKIVMVNAYEFVPLLTKGMVFRRYTKMVQGIPADAKVLAMSADTNRHGIMFVIESAEYPLVPLVQAPPIQLLEIQTELKNATKSIKGKRKTK